MTNTLTIEMDDLTLCEEDRARLDTIIDLLRKIASEPVEFELVPTKAVAETQEAPKAEAGESVNPTTENPSQPEIKSPVTPESTKPTITLQQVQQKVLQLAAGRDVAMKAKVREVINAYAEKVSAIPEDKLTEVWERLTALESEG